MPLSLRRQGTRSASFFKHRCRLPLHLEELEPRVLLSPASAPYITHVYDDLLKRPVDPVGLIAWSRLVDQGVGRDKVALAIVQSPEHRGRQVEDLYGALLHRHSDPGGLQSSIRFLTA